VVRRHTTLIALLLIGLIQTVAYFCVFRTDRPGWPGVECGVLDKGCYLQNAANILEGHPFVFTEGDKPSTGTTSLLYPYVLALPMALGFTGDAVHAPSFALAVFLYLTFLFGWGRVAEKKLPPGFARAAAVAGIGLSGHCAYTAFMQTDQALWMPVSALICNRLCDWDATSRSGRQLLPTILLLALGPWVRPEGTMLIIAFYIYLILNARRTLADFATSGLFRLSVLFPLLSVLALYSLNCLVTGAVTPTSMAAKGYFNLADPIIAVKCTIRDMIGIFMPYLLSIPSECTRFFSMPSPVLSVFFLVGAAAAFRRFRVSWPGWIFVLAAGADVFSVSLSGYSGLDYDRYLAWMMPLPALIAAQGLHNTAAFFSDLHPPSAPRRSPSSVLHPLSALLSKLPIVALVAGMLFPMVSMVLLANEHLHCWGDRLARIRRYAAALPPDSLTGTLFFLVAYQFPRDRAVRDIGGIYSPDYAPGVTDANAYERMKYRPDLRVTHWLLLPFLAADDSHFDKPGIQEAVFGPILHPADTNGYIRTADYAAFDRAAKCPIAGEELARLDVCYLPDEKASEYRPRTSLEGNFVSFPWYADGIFDCGRFVTDGVSFRPVWNAAAVRPQEGALRLVLRTVGSFSTMSNDRPIRRDYPSPARIALEIEGRTVTTVETPLRAEGSFTDCVFDIPAGSFASARPTFVLRGDFALFALWIVRPPPSDS